jgi:hypothetical protein
VAIAPEFMASTSSGAMSGQSVSSQDTMSTFSIAPDQSQQSLQQLESLFHQTNSLADFQSMSGVVSDSGARTIGYNQVTQQANDCSFPNNNHNHQPVPIPDSQSLSLSAQSSLNQSDFLSHGHQNPGQISSSSSQETMSINAMSQMTENELLWVINPSTFDPCV